MTRVVLDASLALAYVLQDEDSTKVLALIGECRRQRVEIMTASHWMLELANGLLFAGRRGRILTAERSAYWEALMELPIQIVWKTAPPPVLFSLADEDALTVSDAAYLALALEREALLATVDPELAAAALRRKCLWRAPG